jgi:histidyl-tRNA synthetase
MRAANRLSAKFVVIRGDAEVEKKTCICKNMENSDQHEISDDQLLDFLEKTP